MLTAKTSDDENMLLGVHFLARTVETTDASSLAMTLRKHPDSEREQLTKEIAAVTAFLLELKSLMQLHFVQDA